MQKVIVKAETMDAITWPRKCSGCGNDVAENATGQGEAKSKKRNFSTILQIKAKEDLNETLR